MFFGNYKKKYMWPFLATLLMMLTPVKMPSVHHNSSCDGRARDEENRMRKESLFDKT